MAEENLKSNYEALQRRYNQLVISSEQERIEFQKQRDQWLIQSTVMATQLNNAEKAYFIQKNIAEQTIVVSNDAKQQYLEEIRTLEEKIKDLEEKLKILTGD